jgi:N-acetylglucosaminyl-diphospho-decaprenol L-rhamnosyltransferase
VTIGRNGDPDPICALLSDGRTEGGPGPEVFGFLACGGILRRRAFLEVGGFHARYGIGGEEELLALDLAAAGWQRCYVPDVRAVHHPAPGPRPGRVSTATRNALWTAWLRRDGGEVARRTTRTALTAVADSAVRDGLLAAVRGLPWVMRERRRVPTATVRAIRSAPR